VARAVTISFTEDCNDYGEISVHHLVVHTVLSAVTLPKPLLWSTQWPLGSSSQICFSLLCFITGLLPSCYFISRKPSFWCDPYAQRNLWFASESCTAPPPIKCEIHHCINMCSGIGGRGRVCLFSQAVGGDGMRGCCFHSSVQKWPIVGYCWPPVHTDVCPSQQVLWSSDDAVFMRLYWPGALWEIR